MNYLSNTKQKTKKQKQNSLFACLAKVCIWLSLHTKEVVLLKLCVLKRDWYSATIKLLHSRNILILGNSERAFNMSTIEFKLNFARQQFAEARIKVLAY